MDFEDGLAEILLLDVVAIDLDSLQEAEEVRRRVETSPKACFLQDIGCFNGNRALAISSCDMNRFEASLWVV